MKKQNKQPEPPEPLSKRFGKMLDYLIERRQFLLNTGRNMKPEYHMRQLVEKFSPYKGYQWTDQGAARFLWYHFPELRQMVPGREENVMNELENLWLASKNFFINQNKTFQQCKQLSAF